MQLREVERSVAPGKPPQSYRFDIFKAIVGRDGQVLKVRSVGTASLLPGTRTYHVRLRTLLKDEFFLLPEDKSKSAADFAILTREPSIRPGRKYYWHRVGEGYVEQGLNSGVMKLSWDLFGVSDIYMTLHPYSTPEEETASASA